MFENCKIKMMIWPPLDFEKNDDIAKSSAYFSWFFGHLAEEVVVPINSSLSENFSMPSYVSAGSLMDFRKVHYALTNTNELNSQNLFTDVNIILIRRRNISDYFPSICAKRFPGSEHVSGIIDDKNENSIYYYYIGSPENEEQDAYYAVCLTYWLMRKDSNLFLKQSQEKLISLKTEAKKFSKISVFGTGPSIVEALDHDHSSSFNIICNTLVKDRLFIDQLSPRIIIAADAHFHLSYHRYSSKFLSDLIYILDNYNITFFTFDKFALFIQRRVPELSGRVFGIPAGRSSFGFNFDRDYRLFSGDSVLNMFLLPIACFLGKNVSLFGFTGRSPNDSFFWNHSDLHQYSDRMEDVRLAHRAFFTNRDYRDYSDEVDKQLSDRISVANSYEKNIISETTSFYSCFCK